MLYIAGRFINRQQDKEGRQILPAQPAEEESEDGRSMLINKQTKSSGTDTIILIQIAGFATI